MEYNLIARNKKILCANHTHEHVTEVISVGLSEFASDYADPHMQLLLECVKIGSSCY